MKRVMLFAVLAAVLAFAAGSEHGSETRHRFFIGIIPTSNEVIVSGTVYLEGVTLANTSATTTDTITIQDRGTDCAGSPCVFIPAVTIAPKTTYVMQFGDQAAPGGILWVSANGTTVGRAHYATKMNP